MLQKLIKTFELEEGRRAPKGHFVVYVGKKLRRFAIPISYLTYPMFQQLMDTAAEEFGYCSDGKIVLPCDEVTFCSVLEYLASSIS